MLFRGELATLLVLAPSFVVEALGIWLSLSLHSGEDACSATNQRLVMAQQAVVMVIPVVWVCWARRNARRSLNSLHMMSEEAGSLKILLGSEDGVHADEVEFWVPLVIARFTRHVDRLNGLVQLSAAIAFFVIAASHFCAASGAWDPFCVTRGPALGGLRWMWAEPSLPSWAMRTTGRIGEALGFNTVARWVGISDGATTAVILSFRLCCTILYFVPVVSGFALHPGEVPRADSRTHWLGCMLMMYLVHLVYAPALPTWMAYLLFHAQLSPSAFSAFGELAPLYHRLALIVLVFGRLLEPAAAQWAEKHAEQNGCAACLHARALSLHAVVLRFRALCAVERQPLQSDQEPISVPEIDRAMQQLYLPHDYERSTEVVRLLVEQRELEDAAFVATPAFRGSQRGRVFKAGAQGVGYYTDQARGSTSLPTQLPKPRGAMR